MVFGELKKKIVFYLKVVLRKFFFFFEGSGIEKVFLDLIFNLKKILYYIFRVTHLVNSLPLVKRKYMFCCRFKY